MNMKQIENKGFGRMRIVERDGDVWFVAADCYGVAGVRDMALRRTVPVKETTTINPKLINGRGTKNMILLTMRGLETFINRYTGVAAKAYMNWIRASVAEMEPRGADSDLVGKIVAEPDFGILLLTELKVEREKRMQLEQKVVELAKWVSENHGVSA